MLYLSVMNLIARPWIVVALLSLLALSPAHAGMTPQEVEMFKDAKAWAEKGEAEGQLNLGVCYTRGHGVAKDDVQAVAWFRKAAVQGFAPAQTLLGHRYFGGEGVPKDQALAVTWYRKAAEQGNASAQMSLGECYGGGKGVEKDFVQAVKWYRKAAEQGHAGAQFNLGGRYYNGEGVTKDEIEAYAYWNLIRITDEDARRNLAVLEKQMSAGQIAAGQKRSKELQKEIDAKSAAKKAGK